MVQDLGSRAGVAINSYYGSKPPRQSGCLWRQVLDISLSWGRCRPFIRIYCSKDRGKVNTEFTDIHHGKQLGFWPVSEEYQPMWAGFGRILVSCDRSFNQTSARNIVTMDFVQIQAILAIFVARKSSGENPRWTDYFWSWTIESQLDRCLWEQEQKQEVTGSVENGRKQLSFS